MKPIALFIGRFQPFHYGHQAIIDYIRSLGYKKLLLLIGDSNETSERNPIEAHDVYSNIRSILRISFATVTLLEDENTNIEWVKTIDSICDDSFPDGEFHLVVHNKPSEAGKYGLQSDQFISDFILANSTKITDSIDLSSMETPSINATDIRNSMSELLKLAPKSSLQALLEAL